MNTQTQRQWASGLRWALWVGFGVLATVPIWTVSSLFFPFITTKAFIFRFVVAACTVIYLALCAVDQTARPRRSWFLAAFTGFVAISAVSAIVGPTPWISLWSDFERSEGLITWIYLLLLLVIASGVLTDRRSWMRMFDLVLGASAVVALVAVGQLLGVSFIRADAGRVDATIGNAAFLASYSLLMAGIACGMFWLRRESAARWAYAVLAVLHSIILIATGTRGAVIGLVVGVLIAGTLIVRRTSRPAIRWGAVAIVIAVVLAGGALYSQRQSEWIQRYPILQRFATISLADRSVQTRFWAWESVWQGVRSNPKSLLFGYGMENLAIPFDQHFNPLQYEDAGSVVWFDRAHNIILDRLATGGVFGLGLYLTIIILPIAALWRRQRQIPDGYWLATWATALWAAYVVQNLFVFDSIVSYVPWVLLSAFVWMLQQEGRTIERLPLPATAAGGLAVVCGIGFFPLVWQTQYLPVQAGRLAISAIQADRAGAPAQDVINKFTEALELDTYGNQELRIQLVQTTDQWVADGRLNAESVRQLNTRVDNELAAQTQENPATAANYLLAARHWYNTRTGRDVQAWYREESQLLDQALALSPTRPEIFYEYGFMELAMAQQQKTDLTARQQHVTRAKEAFGKAIALNPAVAESYVNAFLVPLVTQNDDEARAIIAQALTAAPNFTRNPVPYFNQMATNAVSYGRFVLAKELYDRLTTLAPNVIEYPIKRAVAVAYAGDDAGAIALAEQLQKDHPEIAQQVDEFIKQIKDGFYREEAKKFQR